MNPPPGADNDWPSAIGLFIINFGVMDLLVLDFLKERLPPERFAKIPEHFKDRIDLIKEQLNQADCPVEQRARFEEFFRRLERFRVLRNHVAHGLLLARPVEGTKNFIVTLSLPRDLDAEGAVVPRNLGFDELVAAVNELTKLAEEFKRLTDAG